MTMSSRIAVMNAGVIKQLGTPTEVYEYPNSRYVAGFIGSINLFEGVIAVDHQSHCDISCMDEDLMIRIGHGITGVVGMKLAAAIRPEKISIQPFSGKKNETLKPNQLIGKIKEIAYQGDISIIHVETKSGRIVRVTIPNMDRHETERFTWDQIVLISWSESSAVVVQQ